MGTALPPLDLVGVYSDESTSAFSLLFKKLKRHQCDDRWLNADRLKQLHGKLYRPALPATCRQRERNDVVEKVGSNLFAGFHRAYT